MTPVHPIWLLDLLDILLVAVLFYRLLILVKGTRSAQMYVGLLLIVFVGFVAVPHHTLPEKMFKDCLKCPRIHCCDEVAMVFGGAGAAAQPEKDSRAQYCATPHVQLRTLRG